MISLPASVQRRKLEMSSSTSRRIKNLQEAKSADDVDKVIDALVQIGQPAIPELLQYAKSPERRRWILVMRIVQKMGYPANKSAMPFIVSQASNLNSPNWNIALSMLKEIGEPAIPEVRDTLSFYSQDCDEYHPEIQGLCTLLEQMGSPVIDSLVSDLLYLLETGTDENFVDEYALWPLRKIGSPKANAAVPLLRDKILSRRKPHIRQVSIEALQDFDPSIVRTLVPILCDCLADDSPAIRASASKILSVLERV
jgi:hypothetical protein